MKPCIRRAWLWLANVALVALLAVACTNRKPQATLPNLSTAALTPGRETSGPADAPLSTPVMSTASPTVESPTPTDTATPTATSTPTSTPTPSPTPTPLPDVRLQLGRSFYRQGNCTAALEHFVALLADPATEADAAAEAHYLSAQCHALNDDPAAAAAAFQEFLEAFPDDPRWPTAHFQLAEAHAALEEWEAAIENYRVYLNDQDAIASAVYERIGDAYVQLGVDDQAIESYQTALENAPYLAQAFALREKVAETHLRHGDYELAIDQYAKILETAQVDAYRAQIEYLLGQTYLLADDAETAYRHWLTALDRYPRTHHAYLSLVELVDAGVKVDEYQRGIVDFYAGVYGPAEQAFYRYLESDTTERRDLARYYIGRAYHLSGNYRLAIDEYEIIIEAYPNNPVAADAWLEKARSMAAQGRVDEAIDTLHSFVETHPDHESAPLALWRVAQLHENAAAWIEAAAAYRRLTQNYPASEQAVEALFRAGLSHFRQADYQAAAEDWQKLVTDYADWNNLSAAQYWLGTSYVAQNNHVEADKWLTAAAESDAFLPSYYALRARHRTTVSAAGAGVTSTQTTGDWPLAQPNLLLEQDETAAQAEVEAWLLDWADPGEETNDLTTLTDTLTQDPRHQRGVAYLAVGLDQEAVNEFEIMRKAREDDPLAMYRLALATRELGVYKTSIRCALRVAELSPAPTIGDAPHFLQRLVYPTYFDDLVLPEAAANDLDPLLVFALIRQESLFESSARSYAQAIGLMQIIPSTGEWIAHRLDWPDFAPTHLTRPYLNVRFGTWYLAQGLNAFQGDLFAALAAYNSGLASPSRWLDAAGGDPDLFVETIDYSQTRHYVQLIYQQHALYRQIYQPQ